MGHMLIAIILVIFSAATLRRRPGTEQAVV